MNFFVFGNTWLHSVISYSADPVDRFIPGVWRVEMKERGPSLKFMIQIFLQLDDRMSKLNRLIKEKGITL